MAGKKRHSSRETPVTELAAGRPRAGKGIGLFVLGMHRSGTSAITRVLNLLGADLGKRLMEPQAGVNDTGFWEDLEVVALHERLLRWRQSSWFDCRPIPPTQHTALIQQTAVAEASGIIRSHFPHSALWAIKDPRLCLFVPTWIQAASALTSRLGFVIFVRSPDEVAASLAKRDGITPGHAYLLWGKHVVESVRASAGKPRTVAVYARLLGDWRREVRSIALNLALEWPVPIDSVADEINRFLDVTRRHHTEATTTSEHSDPLHRIVHDIYLTLLAIADGDLEWNATEALFARFDDLAAATAPQIHSLLDHVMSHSDRANKAELALARFVAELEGSGASEERERARQELELARLAELAGMRQEKIDSLLRRVEDLTAEASALHAREAEFAAVGRDREAIVASLGELVASRDQRLRELVTRLDEETETWAVAEQQIRNELQESDNRWKAEVAVRVQLEAKLESLDKVIARMDQEFRAVSDEFATQAELVAQLKIEREQLKGSLAERDRELADRDLELVQRGCGIVSLSAAISAAEAEAVKQARQAASNEAEILLLSMQSQALEARLHHSQEIVAHRDSEIEQMLASKSWKATAPLRWIAGILRKRIDV